MPSSILLQNKVATISSAVSSHTLSSLNESCRRHTGNLSTLFLNPHKKEDLATQQHRDRKSVVSAALSSIKLWHECIVGVPSSNGSLFFIFDPSIFHLEVRLFSTIYQGDLAFSDLQDLQQYLGIKVNSKINVSFIFGCSFRPRVQFLYQRPDIKNSTT